MSESDEITIVSGSSLRLKPNQVTTGSNETLETHLVVTAGAFAPLFAERSFAVEALEGLRKKKR